MAHLHLLLAAPPPITPSLGKLIARGRREGAPGSGLTATLVQLIGALEPIASLMLAAEGHPLEPGFWLRADPVHMLAGMHSISLLDSRRFDLDNDEAQALVDALNGHFGAEARFVAPHPQRWYVRLAHPLNVDVPALDELGGQPVGPDLVSGTDATRLQRFAMETQMLLHDHAVNDAREERGELPINGLWFWGIHAAQAPTSGFDRVWADDFTARTLATAAGLERSPLPPQFEVVPGRNLAILTPGDEWEGIDEDWFAPVLSALKRGRLKSLVLEVPGEAGYRLELDRGRAWRLWAA